MTFQSAGLDAVVETLVTGPPCPGIAPIGAPAGQLDWIDRCRASILATDPRLLADDILDLAATLWERPRCRALPPERAVELLFAGKLSPSS